VPLYLYAPVASMHPLHPCTLADLAGLHVKIILNIGGLGMNCKLYFGKSMRASMGKEMDKAMDKAGEL